MLRFKFLEHMTDAEIEAYGSTLEEAYENAGIALEETMVDTETVEKKVEDQILVTGTDKESLLYSWLESLIVKQDTEGMLYSKFKCRITKTTDGLELSAQALGEKFDSSRHEQRTAIKAPTYHGMEIVETTNRVIVKFLLDL